MVKVEGRGEGKNSGGFKGHMPSICRALGDLLLWLISGINGDEMVLEVGALNSHDKF